MARSISASTNARVAAGAVLLALAACASAQGVYRSVGPDGKVTYTDKPPAGDSTQLRGGHVPAAPAAAAASAVGAHKSAVGVSPTASPSAEALTRSLKVMVNVDSLVTGFVNVCSYTLPASAKKYSDAADGWRGRHRDLLHRRDMILNDTLTNAQRRQMAEDGKAEARKQLDAVYKSPVDSRVRWCDTTTEEIAAGKLDRYKDQSVAGPLMGYKKTR